MGKIVKFCSSCDEGFAEKFAFCPNCGGALQTFEMNPVVAQAPVIEETPIAEPTTAAPVAAEVAEPADAFKTYVEPAKETPSAFETVESFGSADEVDEPLIEKPYVEEPVIEEPVVPVVKAAPKAAAAAPTFAFSRTLDADRKPKSLEDEHSKALAEGGFYVTVIEEKNVKQRNALLAGACGFMLFALMSALVYNIFSKDLEVGSINDEIFNAVIVDDAVMTVEEKEQQKKDKDAGGGGGGGRNEKEEVTQGDLADQSKNPTRPPDAKVFRSDNFELQTPPPQTEGNQKFEKKFDRWGDPNGRFASFSNGTGSGGGQGSGTGTGQGSGRGTGAGSGDGSGYGGGLGNGNGNGSGSGDYGPPPPPKALNGVTQGIKILAKPRPGYTDSARTANIQGTVILRVVFLASGQIGSISPVKGLPNGLTEQAIAAARRISFEPAKNNGLAQTVTKQIEYSFSIY